MSTFNWDYLSLLEKYVHQSNYAKILVVHNTHHSETFGGALRIALLDLCKDLN